MLGSCPKHCIRESVVGWTAACPIDLWYGSPKTPSTSPRAQVTIATLLDNFLAAGHALQMEQEKLKVGFTKMDREKG